MCRVLNTRLHACNKTRKLTPSSAGNPPASPQGRNARRSESTLTVKGFRDVIERAIPSPPGLAPLPPEPRRSPNEFRMAGYLGGRREKRRCRQRIRACLSSAWLTLGTP